MFKLLYCFILLLVIYILIIIIKKYIIFINGRNSSIDSFITRVNNEIKFNNLNISKEYVFNRFIKYKNMFVPLGKVIFDEVNKKIIIYETFIYKLTKFVCIPDIWCFSYFDVIECDILVNNVLLYEIENDYILNNKKNAYIRIKLKECHYYIILRFMSINDIDLFVKLYKKMIEVINKNK